MSEQAVDSTKTPVKLSVRTDLSGSAHQVWTARVDQDYPTLFEYQSVADRERITQEEFTKTNQEKGLFRFDSYNIHEVTSDEDMGWVDVERICRVTQFPGLDSQKVRTWEKWYRFDGKWYPCTSEQMDLLPTVPKERNAAEEQVLRKRFTEFCELRISSHFEKLYEFLPPAAREKTSLSTYMEGESLLRVLSCQMLWAEVVGDVGRIRAEYLLQSADPSLTKMPPYSKTVMERWQKIDGAWYRMSMVDRGCGR